MYEIPSSFWTTSLKIMKLAWLCFALLTSTCWEIGPPTLWLVLKTQIFWLHQDVKSWNLWLKDISSASQRFYWTLTTARSSDSAIPTGKEAKKAFELLLKDFLALEISKPLSSMKFHKKTRFWGRTTFAQLSACTPAAEKRMLFQSALNSVKQCRKSTKSLVLLAPINWTLAQSQLFGTFAGLRRRWIWEVRLLGALPSRFATTKFSNITQTWNIFIATVTESPIVACCKISTAGWCRICCCFWTQPKLKKSRFEFLERTRARFNCFWSRWVFSKMKMSWQDTTWTSKRTDSGRPAGSARKAPIWLSFVMSKKKFIWWRFFLTFFFFQLCWWRQRRSFLVQRTAIADSRLPVERPVQGQLHLAAVRTLRRGKLCRIILFF